MSTGAESEKDSQISHNASVASNSAEPSGVEPTSDASTSDVSTSEQRAASGATPRDEGASQSLASEVSRGTPATSVPEPSAPPPEQPSASEPPRALALPPFGLVPVCLTHAGVFIAGSVVLPWRTSYAFLIPLCALAALHLAVSAFALSKKRELLRRAWTALAVASLAALALLTWSLSTSALYLIELYRGIGAGVAVGLFVFWLVAVLFTVPVAWWGLALIRPRFRPSRAARAAGVALVVLSLVSPFVLSRSAHAEPIAGGDARLSASRLAAVAQKHVAREDSSEASSEKPTNDREGKRPRKGARADASRKVAPCDEAPSASKLTLFVTTSARRAKARCLQAADEASLTRALEAFLEQGDDDVRLVRLDLASGIHRLGSLELVLDALELRPGRDGVCAGARCLTPWQLVASSAFGAVRPLAAVGDLAFGADFAALRRQLGASDDAALTRLETQSVVVSAQGVKVLDTENVSSTPNKAELERASADVERHVERAQLENGGFRYTLEPFSGSVDETSTNVPRHAGTTLALCELGQRADVPARIEKALDFMTQFEHKLGNMTAYSNEADKARLGPTALPLVALLSCRSRVDKSYDDAIARAGRLLLHMQRPDGSFFPELSLQSGQPRGEHQPLYAAGQAVLALTLLEAWAPENERATYRDATERAMQYYAGPYWHSAPYDFFFLEENWHCLAARAALTSHRNDAYERFCLDYVEFKSRLIFDEGQGETRALSGGYGVSPVFAPHNTATAGYGEALAAAISVRRARHMPVGKELALLERVLGFLVRNQWQSDDCFACARRADTLGGFSESSTSPILRIDYAQHAWAALGHGARELARLEPNG